MCFTALVAAVTVSNTTQACPRSLYVFAQCMSITLPNCANAALSDFLSSVSGAGRDASAQERCRIRGGRARRSLAVFDGEAGVDAWERSPRLVGHGALARVRSRARGERLARPRTSPGRTLGFVRDEISAKNGRERWRLRVGRAIARRTILLDLLVKVVDVYRGTRRNITHGGDGVDHRVRDDVWPKFGNSLRLVNEDGSVCPRGAPEIYPQRYARGSCTRSR